MFTHFRRSLLSLAREQPAALWLVFGMLLAGPSLAADRVERTARAISPVVVTNFEQIWQMTEAETKEWHRLRMEYVVYYYDPLWQAMWGRCGEADSYLSVGSKPFPIKPGQKILVEGLILPAAGMNVDEPRVTVLAETAPVEVLSTAGEIGNSQRFNKRLVTVEGYVDRQSARDANHHELALVVEGQSVLVQFLVRTGEIVPALKGALIRAQGVYFARNEPTWTSPRLEIWVPGIKSITELGRIERDDRFRPPPTPIDRLGEAPPDRLVRIVGTVQAQQPGKSLTLLGETGQLTFPTVQTQPVAADEQVEVSGYPVRRGTEWSVQQGLYRPVQKIIGSFEELGLVPEERRNEVHKARFDFLVYYYDPRWKVAWGRCAGSDNFLALGEVPFPVRPGQLIHLEGLVVPANGMVLDELKVTPLAEPVSLEALTTTGRIGQTELFDKHMVTVDGRVERQTPIDSTHLKIDLIAEGRPVTVRLLLEGDTAPPELEGAVLRVKGVYSATRDSTGAEPKLEVWVQGLPNIEVLQQPAKAPLPRGSLRVIANFDDLQMVPESERKQAHQVRLDFLVYFHDPRWKVAWGRCAGSDNYLALGEVPFPLRPGQLVHIEGTVIPANGIISEPKITSLAEPVPLEVLSTKGQIGQTERFDKHMVTLEGYADRQTATDGTHLKIDLVSEGRAVAVRLLFDGKTILPDMEGALLRLKGVYSATIDPTGALPNIEVWVQDQQNIEVIGSLAQDAQFDLPATSIEKLPSAEAGKLVRVVGVVRKQQAGLSLTIRDETGQLILHTAQTRPVQLGEQVEAIGYPLLVGTEWHLRESMYRHAQTANGAPAHDLAQLRLAEQLLDLSHEEAKRGHPVHLNGVVTWVNPAADFFYIRDASGGVCVLRPREPGSALRVGAKVEVSGVSAPGKFVPVVQAIGVVQTASIDMPEAKQVTLEQALTGIEEAQWVGMSGYVRDVAQDGPWGRLELTTSAGEFAAVLPWGEQLVNLRRSVVRMRGVCSALTNEKRQLTGIQLWVPSEQYLEIEEAEPANPFTVAAQSITSLRQFSSLQATNRRVRVAGVVVHHAPGLRALIQEGSEGLLVLSRDTTPLVPGDRIEAVGFPGRENSRVVLREAVYHRLSSGAEPVPLVVDSLDRINVELDSRLVRIDAQLLDVGAQEKGTRLIMQAGGVIFEALLDAQKSTVPDR